MKATLVYELTPGYWRIDRDVEIAKSGKTLDLGTWSPRVKSLVWGDATPELVAEAKRLKAAQDALNKEHAALRRKLEATQPALLAAAAKAPMSPKAVPERVDLRITDDLV